MMLIGNKMKIKNLGCTRVRLKIGQESVKVLGFDWFDQKANAHLADLRQLVFTDNVSSINKQSSVSVRTPQMICKTHSEKIS